MDPQKKQGVTPPVVKYKSSTPTVKIFGRFDSLSGRPRATQPPAHHVMYKMGIAQVQDANGKIQPTRPTASPRQATVVTVDLGPRGNDRHPGIPRPTRILRIMYCQRGPREVKAFKEIHQPPILVLLSRTQRYHEGATIGQVGPQGKGTLDRDTPALVLEMPSFKKPNKSAPPSTFKVVWNIEYSHNRMSRTNNDKFVFKVMPDLHGVDTLVVRIKWLASASPLSVSYSDNQYYAKFENALAKGLASILANHKSLKLTFVHSFVNDGPPPRDTLAGWMRCDSATMQPFVEKIAQYYDDIWRYSTIISFTGKPKRRAQDDFPHRFEVIGETPYARRYPRDAKLEQV